MSTNIWRRWVTQLFNKNLRKRVRPRRRLVFELLEDRIVPVTNSWTGMGLSPNWSVAANWSLGVPVAGQDLSFGLTTNLATVDNINPGAYNSITFASAGYSIASSGTNVIELSGALNVNSNLGTEKITANIVLIPPLTNPEQTFSINAGSTLEIGSTANGSLGQLINAGTAYSRTTLDAAQQTLLVNGPGILQLDANNATTLTGSITIANGATISITNQNALGSGNPVAGAPNAGKTTINPLSELELNPIAGVSLTVPENLIISGTGVGNAGALYNNAGNNTYSGTISMDGATTIAANGVVNGNASTVNTTLTIGTGGPAFGGLITDQGAPQNLTIGTASGDGTVVMARPGGNTYRGTTSVNNGILEIEDPFSLGAGAGAVPTTPSGTPQDETIVNYNATTGQAGTLELNFLAPNAATKIGLGENDLNGVDPNGVLNNPALGYGPTNNPYVGFQVFNDLLVLNGPGFNSQHPNADPNVINTVTNYYPDNSDGNLGALYNRFGDNGWDGNVTLGSLSSSDPVVVSIGVAANTASVTQPNTNLTISGAISDPTFQEDLIKVGQGRLILTDASPNYIAAQQTPVTITTVVNGNPTSNVTSFISGTLIAGGEVEMTDSTALGPASSNEIYVLEGASLELGVDSGLDGTALSTHGRNLGFDSATGSGPGQEVYVNGSSGTFTLHFEGEVTSLLNVADPNLAADMQVALNALPDFNTPATNVTVTQDGDIYRILGGALDQPASGTSVPLLTVAPTSTNPVSTVIQVNSIYGLNVSNVLDMDGLGASAIGGSPEGALDSLNGINTYSGEIILGDTGLLSPDLYQGSIGVLPDSDFLGGTGGAAGFFPGQYSTLRTGHPLADDNYLQFDDSLTVNGGIENFVNPFTGIVSYSSLTKYGGGQLILPNANNYGYSSNVPYSDAKGLGPAYNDTTDPLYNTVNEDELNAKTGISNPSTIVTAGWITIEDPNALGLDQSPGTPTQIAQLVEPTLGPPLPIAPTNGFIPQSNLITVQVEGGASVQINPDIPGTNWNLYYNWILQGEGLRSTPGTGGVPGQPFSLIDQGALESMAGDNSINGIIQLNGMAGIGVEQVFPTTVTPALTASQLTITNNVENYPGNGKTSAVGAGGLTKLGSRRLIMQGQGSFTGNVVIADGVLLDQSNTGLGAGNTLIPVPPTANLPTVTVTAGTALELGNTIATENGGVAGGLGIWGDNLILNGTGDPTFGDTPLTIEGGDTPTGATTDTLTITGSMSDGYYLSFGGQTTAEIQGSASAAQLQSALDALSTIGGAGGSVSVYQSLNGDGTEGNVYTITFQGSLIDTSTQLTVTDGYTTVGGVAIVPVPTIGNFALSFNGFTTGALAASAPASAVQAALDALTSIGEFIVGGVAGSVSVALDATKTNYVITFGGSLAGENTNPIQMFTGTFPDGAIAQPTVPVTNANYSPVPVPVVQIGTPTVYNVTTSGDFSLSFGGASTGLILGTATPGDLQNDLNALSSIDGLATVTGTPGDYTITFGTALAPNALTNTSTALVDTSLITAVSSLTSNATDVMPFQDQLFPTDDLWDGPVTLKSSTTIDVETNSSATQPDSRLIINGNITSANGASNNLTLTGGGELDLDGSDSYGGTTFIDQGIMTIGSNEALGGTPVSEIQTLDLSSVAANTQLNLTFTPYFGAASSTTFTYTGTASDLANFQAALAALPSLGESSSYADSGAVVTVTEPSTGVFQIVYGGTLTGFQQNPLQATAGANTYTATDAGATDQIGAGGTVVYNGASLQLAGSFTVAGEPLLVQGNGDGAESIPTQWFQVGPAGSTNGQAGTGGAQSSNNQNNVSGQVTGVVTDPANPNIIYIATAGGGAWKTVNDGVSWTPIFDSIPQIDTVNVNTAGSFTLTFTYNGNTETTTPLSGSDTNLAQDMQTALNNLTNIGQAGGVVGVTETASGVYSVTFGGTLAGLDLSGDTPSVGQLTATGGGVTLGITEKGAANAFGLYIGSIAMDPKNDNILYIGTGNTNNNANSNAGTGIYESTDGGVTWQLLTGNTTEQVTLQGQGTDIQQVSIYGTGIEEQTYNAGGTAGGYKLTIPGVGTTATIAYNATSAAVQSAIQTLLNTPGAPNTGLYGPVLVDGGLTGPTTYDVYFFNMTQPAAPSSPDVPFSPPPTLTPQEMIGVTTGTKGSDPHPAGHITMAQTPGTFELMFAGQTTIPLPYNATDHQIQAALNALPGVAKQYGPFEVEPATAPNLATGTNPVGPIPETQSYTEINNPNVNYTLSWNGQVTGNIPGNSSPATILQAIDALAIPPNNVVVTNNPNNPDQIFLTFSNVESYYQQPFTFGGPASMTSGNVNEQLFTSAGPSGDFYLTYDGLVSPELPYNAADTDVQTALQNLLDAADSNSITVTSVTQPPSTTLASGSHLRIVSLSANGSYAVVPVAPDTYTPITANIGDVLVIGGNTYQIINVTNGDWILSPNPPVPPGNVGETNIGWTLETSGYEVTTSVPIRFSVSEVGGDVVTQPLILSQQGGESFNVVIQNGSKVAGPIPSISVVNLTGTNFQNAQTNVATIQQEGSFTLTYNGQTTQALPYNANAQDVANALNALSTIQDGPTGGGFGGSVTVTRSQLTDVQWFQSYGTQGTFTLTVMDPSKDAAFTTAPIAYNATAGTVQAALNAADATFYAPNVNPNIEVEQSGESYFIAFSGSLTTNNGVFSGMDFAQPSVLVAAQGGDLVTSINNPNASSTGAAASGGPLLEKTEGGEVFTVNFGGTFAGSANVLTLTGEGTPITLTSTEVGEGITTGDPSFTVNNVTVSQPFNPAYGKGVSQIVPEGNGLVLVSTADSVAGTDEVQSLTFSAGTNGLFANVPFTLSFTGAGANGVVSTQTTPQILFAPLTQVLDPVTNIFWTGLQSTEAQIQYELDSLSNIGGVGGQVVVQAAQDAAGITYTVTFEGSLSDLPVAQLTAAYPAANLTITDAVVTPGAAPQAINGTVGPVNTTEDITFANMTAGDTFELEFTNAAGTDTEITQVMTYGEPFINPVTGATYVASVGAELAAEIQYYLDQLSNIGGAGGNVQVTYLTSSTEAEPILQITFDQGLSDTDLTNNLQVFLLSTQSPFATAIPSVGTTGVQVASGEGGAPGIWEFTPLTLGTQQWTNLTGSTASNSDRNLMSSGNANDNVYGSGATNLPGGTGAQGIPGAYAPGPDDDYTVSFPQSGATWSGLQVVPFGGRLVIFAALGTASGSPDNGVFWATIPTGGQTTAPIWNQGGNGGADAESNLFPTSSLSSNPPEIGNIKISATDPLPLATSPKVIYVDALVSAPDGQLLNIYQGVWSNPPSMSWAPDPATANLLSNLGGYDAAIAVNPQNQNDVFVGGTANPISGQAGQIYESTSAGGTFTDISLDANGNGPHTSQQFMAVDLQGDLLTGGDGGIWTYNADEAPERGFALNPNATWSDINGDLAISQVDSVASNPTSIDSLLAGIQSNGLSVFSNGQVWNLANNTSGLPGDLGGGQVYINPQNPLEMYAVETQLGSYASVVFSQDGGKTWQNITPNGLTGPFPQGKTVLSSTIPFVMDTLNPSRLLVGGGTSPGLFESFNGGTNWENIAGTYNEPELPQTLALPINVSLLAISQYQGAFVPDQSFPDVTDQGTDSYDSNTIYASDGTNIYVTKDNALTWAPRNISNSFFGYQLGHIVQIVVDPRNRDTIYAVTQGYEQDNAAAQGDVFMSTNAGQSWTLIAGTALQPDSGTGFAPLEPNTAGLPQVPAWTLTIDPRNGNVYVGNNLGVYELVDGAAESAPGVVAVPFGGTWQRVGTGMPDVQVRDISLNLQTNTLLAATFGRSVYELFLDAQQIAVNETPVQAAVIGLSGSSFWTGNVILSGVDIPNGSLNTVTFGSDGVQDLPNEFAAASLNFVGSISDLIGSDDPTLDKNGGGDIVFSGDNIYGGYTNILDGVLIADNLNALGQFNDPALDGTTVYLGATLALEADLDAETVYLIGDGNSFDGHFGGSLLNITGNNTFEGDVVLVGPGVSYGIATGAIATEPPVLETGDDSVTVGADAGSELTLSGSITGGDQIAGDTDANTGFRFAKEGTGTVSINNTAPDTFVAVTDVYQGVLGLETSAAVASTDPIPGDYVGTGTINVIDGARVQVENGQAIQTLLITATSGTFTLSFTGPNALSIPVTDVTIPLDVTDVPATLASMIESALNALANIGGVQGNVTVTYEGSGLYSIAFGGGLLGATLPLLSVGNDSTLVGGMVSVNPLPVEVDNPLFLSGTGIFGTGALVDAGGNNAWLGPITFTVFPGFSPDTTPEGLVAIGVTNPGDVFTLGTTTGNPTTAPDEITDSAGLTLGLLKVGAGTLALPSTNAYGGQTEVQNGVVLVQNENALGTRTGSLNAESTIQQLVTVSDTGAGEFNVSIDGVATEIPFGASSSFVASRIDNLLFQGASQGFFASGGFVSVTVQQVETTTENIGPSFSSPTFGFVYDITFEGSLIDTDIPLEVFGLNGTNAAATFVAQGQIGSEQGTDVLVDNGGEIDLDNSLLPAGQTLNMNYNLILNGDGANGDGNGALYNLHGNNTWSGQYVLAAPSSVGVNGANAVQTISVTPGNYGFVLSFTGPDGTGATVTDSTPNGSNQTQTNYELMANSPTLASDIQGELDALTNIGGVGGNVTVTETGARTNVYTITFGGALAGVDVSTLSVTSPTNGDVTVLPSNEQILTFNPNATGDFVLSYTGPDASGAIATDNTPGGDSSVTSPDELDATSAANSPTIANDIQNALNALPNIGGVGGYAIVTELSPGEFEVTLNQGTSPNPLLGGNLGVTTQPATGTSAPGITLASVTGFQTALTFTGPGSVVQANDILQKVDPGLLIFSNTSTYTGQTQISAGNVQVDGTISNVILDGGTLNGTGPVVPGQVGLISTTTNGGVIDPSDNSPTNNVPGETAGTLTSAGPTALANPEDVLNSSDTYFVDLSTPGSPFGTSDLLNITNAGINLGGATLTGIIDPSVTGGTNGSIPVGTSYVIVQTDYNGTNPNDEITGTFAGATPTAASLSSFVNLTPPAGAILPPSGPVTYSLVWIGNEMFVVSYYENEVVLTRELEPATLALAIQPTTNTYINTGTNSYTVDYGQDVQFLATLTTYDSLLPADPALLSGTLVFTVKYTDTNDTLNDSYTFTFNEPISTVLNSNGQQVGTYLLDADQIIATAFGTAASTPVSPFAPLAGDPPYLIPNGQYQISVSYNGVAASPPFQDVQVFNPVAASPSTQPINVLVEPTPETTVLGISPPGVVVPTSPPASPVTQAYYGQDVPFYTDVTENIPPTPTVPPLSGMLYYDVTYTDESGNVFTINTPPEIMAYVNGTDAIGSTVINLAGASGAVFDGEVVNFGTDPTNYTIVSHTETGGVTTSITLSSGLNEAVTNGENLAVLPEIVATVGANAGVGGTSISLSGATGTVYVGETVNFGSDPTNYTIIGHTETGGVTTSITLSAGLHAPITAGEAVEIYSPLEVKLSDANPLGTIANAQIDLASSAFSLEPWWTPDGINDGTYNVTVNYPGYNQYSYSGFTAGSSSLTLSVNPTPDTPALNPTNGPNGSGGANQPPPTVASALISSASETNTTVTITTSAAIGDLVAGQLVTVSGISPSGFDGTFTVASVNATGTQFTYTAAAGLGTATVPAGAIATSDTVLYGQYPDDNFTTTIVENSPLPNPTVPPISGSILYEVTYTQNNDPYPDTVYYTEPLQDTTLQGTTPSGTAAYALLDLNAGQIAASQVPEVQTITVNTTSSFTLSFNGSAPVTVPANPSASLMELALAQISTIGQGNVSVIQNGNEFTVVFIGLPGAQHLISNDGNPNISVVETQAGGSLVAPWQTNDGLAVGTYNVTAIYNGLNDHISPTQNQLAYGYQAFVPVTTSLTFTVNPTPDSISSFKPTSGQPTSAGGFSQPPPTVPTTVFYGQYSDDNFTATVTETSPLPNPVVPPLSGDIVYQVSYTNNGDTYGSPYYYTAPLQDTSAAGTTAFALLDINSGQISAANVPEVQTITVNTTSSFDLSFNGSSQVLVPANPTASQLQQALSSLTTIGLGNVTVIQSGDVYTVVFIGSMDGAKQPLISNDGNANVGVVETQVGGVFSAPWQTNDGLAVGTYNITASYNGVNTSDNLAFVPPPPSALSFTVGPTPDSIGVAATNGQPTTVGGFPVAPPTVPNPVYYGQYPDETFTATVTQNSPLPTPPVPPLSGTVVYEVTYTDTTSNTHQSPYYYTEQLEDTSAAGTNAIAVLDLNTLTAANVPEVQTLTLNTASSFDLSFNGSSQVVLPADPTAAQLQQALSSLSTIGAGNVSVIQSGNVYTIVFVGSMDGAHEPLIVSSGGNTVNEVQVGGKLLDPWVTPYGLAAGQFSVTASYNGINTADFQAFIPVSASPPPFVVALPPLTLSITGNPVALNTGSNPAATFLYGQGDTFTANLALTQSYAPSVRPLSGDVVFTVVYTDPFNPAMDATNVYDVPMVDVAGSNGTQATALLNNLISNTTDTGKFNYPLLAGDYAITASYDGVTSPPAELAFNPVTFPAPPAPPVAVDVNQGATAITLATSDASPVYSEPVTFTATVTSQVPNEVVGTLAPTGTVSFYDGPTLLGTGTVTSSSPGTPTSPATTTWTFSTTSLSYFLSIGQHSITAVYGGDNNYKGVGPSSVVIETVKADGTNVSVTSAPNPPYVYGQPITFTATVTANAPGAGIPAGTVEFEVVRNGVVTRILGTETLNANGVATVTANIPGELPVILGGDEVQVVYSGQGGDFQSNTGDEFVTIEQDPTATTLLTPSPSPSTYGQPVTFTAQVLPTLPGSGAPTGTVDFLNGGTLLGTGTLSSTIVATGTNLTENDSSNLNEVAPEAPDSYVPSAKDIGDTLLITNGSGWTVGSYQIVGFDNTTKDWILNVSPASLGASGGQWSLDVMATSYTTTLPSQLPASGSGSLSITAQYLGDTNFAASTSSAQHQTVQQDPTTITFLPPPPPTPVYAYGQPVTFNVQISPTAPGAGNPTGNVEFFLNSINSSNELGLGSAVTSGTTTTASFTTTTNLPVGTWTIFAEYLGDSNFSSSTTNPGLPVTVTKDAVTTTVSSNLPRGSVYGQQVTFSATVSATGVGGGSTPTGTVIFYDNGTAISSPIQLNSSGLASFTTPTSAPLITGTNDITVAYSGDSNYAANDNGSFIQTVSQDATTTSVNSSGPSIYGNPVTFNVTVGANFPGAGNPTGDVYLYVTVNGVQTELNPNNPAVLTPGSGSTSTASFTTSAAQLQAGLNEVITATYVGDTNFTGSSGTTSQTVHQGQVAVNVVPTPSSAVYGQPVVLTATIVPTSGTITPTGTVTFLQGTVELANVAVVNGVATYTTTPNQLPDGLNDLITAQYSGDSNYAFNTGTTSVSVGQDSTTTILSTETATVNVGQQFFLTATVTANSPGSGTPTGTVSFFDFTTQKSLGTAPLVNGTANLQTAFTVKGPQLIQAVYATSTNYQTSKSNQLTVVADAVGARLSTMTVKSSENPSPLGGLVTFTATVKDAGLAPAKSPAPAGVPVTVSFMDGNTLLGYGMMVSAPGLTTETFTFTTSSLPLGSNSIRAVYNGDINFARSTSATIIQSVFTPPTRTSTLALASSGTPTGTNSYASAFGQTVLFTATVTDSGPGQTEAPAGTVTFSYTVPGSSVVHVLGTATLGTAVVNSSGEDVATVTLATSTLLAGTYNVTATYNGSKVFAADNPVTITQVITKVNTITTLTSSTANDTSVFGQAVTFTAKVVKVSGGAPIGTVTFTNQAGKVLKTVALNANGVASFTTTALAVGSDQIVATYNGNANVQVSSSQPLVQTVNQDSVILGLTTSTTVANTNPTVITCTVTATKAGAGVPTGTVEFNIDNGALVETVTLIGGKATLTLGGLASGTHTIVAEYSGSSDFLANDMTITPNFTIGRPT